MNKKLFVGSLPFATSDEELLTLFQAHGEVVSAKVIMDKKTHKSKGYGFVEMATEEMATNAVNSLNETEFKGRKIIVSESKSTGEKTGNGGGFGERPRRTFNKRRF